MANCGLPVDKEYQATYDFQPPNFNPGVRAWAGVTPETHEVHGINQEPRNFESEDGTALGWDPSGLGQFVPHHVPSHMPTNWYGRGPEDGRGIEGFGMNLNMRNMLLIALVAVIVWWFWQQYEHKQF